MTEQMNFYDIVKHCRGSLTLVLPAYDMSSQPREVRIDHNLKKVRVPRVFALGVFANPTLESMYKEGMFTVEPAQKFQTEIAEIFYPIENQVEATSDKEIITMLKQGNRIGIKKVLESGTTNRDNVIILARNNIGEISLSMIDFLNDILQVELQIENDTSVE